MASAMVTTTPVRQISAASAVTPPPTGTWQHPRFDEITRRKRRVTFTDRNVNILMWNGGLFLATYTVPWGLEFTYAVTFNFDFQELYLYVVLSDHRPTLFALLKPIAQYAGWPILFLRLFLLLNVALALSPIVLPKDDLVDIPLTPSQRALLGLDPKVTPVGTPASEYSTPPRYPRSATPRTGSSAGRGSPLSGSPRFGRGTPSPRITPGASPFTNNVSPLLQKALEEDGRVATRRHSYGSSSLRDSVLNGMESSLISLPSTPSPSRGKGSSLALNSKWRYEKVGEAH